MFLRALKDKFKVKSATKFLKSELGKKLENTVEGQGIEAVGCIVDLDSFDQSDRFYELLEEFKLKPNAIKLIGYKGFYDKNSPYSTPVFSDKDLGWDGTIENSYALEFLGRRYDLLINYYDKDKLPMKLMTVRTNARLKVGFGEVDQALNDLILHTPLKDFGAFKKELKKYLLVLNEIK